MSRQVLAIATLAAVLGAGCVAPLSPAATVPDAADPLLAAVKLLSDPQGFEIEAPVHVLLLGFPSGTGAALQEKLAPTRIEHKFLDNVRAFPPNPANPTGASGTLPMPVVPVAIYRVHEADAATTEAFLTFAKSTGSGGILDGNAAEDWLAANLPATGFPISPQSPVLVVLHGGETLGEHGWRYTFPQGWLEPVRGFGERHPLLVFDVSAMEDPYVTRGPIAQPPAARGLLTPHVPTGPVARAAYNYVLEPSGAETLDALALLVGDATHFRLLQSAIYPIPTKSCHAVTLILAIRGYSPSERIGLEAEKFVDVPGITAALENLTGKGNVKVDLKVLLLPVDDPVLEVMIPRFEAQLDAFRYWLDTNWDKYWVAHEGCEPYVSFLVSGDSPYTVDFGGIAMYGVKDTHRISFSVVDDLRRIRQEGPLAALASDRAASIEKYDSLNRLYAHETGHLVGQHHPHNVIRTDGGTAVTPAFSAVWSVMSYQNRERLVDFGAVDQANYWRNRAGFVVQAALHEDLQGTPEFEEALAHLARFEFKEAGDVLVPKLDAAHGDGCDRKRC